MIKKRVVSALLAIAMILSCMIPLAACGASAELSSIEITAEPTKTTYIAGEKFDPAGMTVTAKYDDDTTRELTAEEWTYDLTGEGRTASWYEIARTVFNLVNHNGDKVQPVTTAEYYANASGPVSPRPEHSALDLTKIKNSGYIPTNWEGKLEEYLNM